MLYFDPSTLALCDEAPIFEVAYEEIDDVSEPCPGLSKRQQKSNSEENTQPKKTDPDITAEELCKQLAPDLQEACPTTYRPLLRSRSNPSQVLLSALPCRRWTCAACASRMVYRLGSHYIDCLTESGDCYWQSLTPACKWNTVQRRLSRACSSYLWIAFGDVRHILSSGCINGGVRLATVDACRTLVDWFLTLPLREEPAERQRVTDSSNDWAPSPYRSGKEWKIFGRVQCDEPEPILAYLAGFGITPNVERKTGGFLVQFRMPEWMDEVTAGIVLDGLRTVRKAA